MGIMTIIVVLIVICTFLWVINASGWVALPPPVRMGINIIVVILFLLWVLSITGLYSFHDVRIGPR